MIEKIKTQEPEDSQSDSFTDKEGNIYKIKMIPDDKEGLLVGVRNGTSKEKRLLPREWEVFKTRKGLEVVTTPEIQTEDVKEVEIKPESNFNILEVKGGDILEMSDGSYLKILENDPINKEVTFEQISPDMDTSKKGEVKSRGYDIFSVYQDEIKDYLPSNKTQEPTSKPKKAKGNNGKDSLNNEVPQDLVSKKRDKSTRWGDSEEEKARNGEKNNADKILDNLDTTPPEDLNLQEVSDWEPGVPEEALETNEAPVVEKPKSGRPKKVMETPPAIKQSLKEAGKIMAELEKPIKKEVPLNLKEGQVIWDQRGNEIIVLDVKTNPVNEDEDLMDGYVTLLYPPQKGRNKGSVDVKVSFSELEKGKNKIFFTEQIPFIEIDEEAEKELKNKIPFNLKRGDVIWGEHNDEMVVLDVVAEPVNEQEALMNGYVLLGFEPKPGRNDDFMEEKVPFSKLKKKKGKISLIDPTPITEINKEWSTSFADLKESLEKEGKWPKSVEDEEPPPLPAEYLAKVEADKKAEENRRLNELREEMREISHGDLGADLAKDWTPINVEMPKRQPPLSPSLRKLPKKSWWQILLGL